MIEMSRSFLDFLPFLSLPRGPACIQYGHGVCKCRGVPVRQGKRTRQTCRCRSMHVTVPPLEDQVSWSEEISSQDQPSQPARSRRQSARRQCDQGNRCACGQSPPQSFQTCPCPPACRPRLGGHHLHSAPGVAEASWR